VLWALSAIIRWISRRLALGKQARRGDESQSVLRALSAIIRWTLRRLALDEQAFARRVAIGASGTERDYPLDITTPRS
jgi:Fe-S cluster assembly ATPase SufC